MLAHWQALEGSCLRLSCSSRKQILVGSAGACIPRPMAQQQTSRHPAPSSTPRSPQIREVHAQGSKGSHAGHAVLHDFCMTIPYGALAAVAGVLAFAFKAPAVAVQLAAVAAVVWLCSVLSLKAWKAGGSSTAYTLVSAGASGWVAYQMWQRVAASAAPVPSGIMLAVSAALCLFCVYNVLAGGNPPPAKKAA